MTHHQAFVAKIAPVADFDEGMIDSAVAEREAFERSRCFIRAVRTIK